MVTRNFQLGRETHKFIGKKIGQENRNIGTTYFIDITSGGWGDNQ